MLSLKNILFLFIIGTLLSCSKDPAPDSPANTSTPTGLLTTSRSGFFQPQNGYNATGTAIVGTDEANQQWLQLASDFDASLSTGAVTLYLSKVQSLNLNESASNIRVALLSKPGEHFYKIDPAIGEDFTFAILWCASAGVQFGNAPLQ